MVSVFLLDEFIFKQQRFNLLNHIFPQQAAEKGLKAAAFMVDSGRARHHRLESIAATTGRSDLQSLASDLSFLHGSAELRYPDRWCYPGIPHDKYNEDGAEKAMQITENLLEVVKKLVQG